MEGNMHWRQHGQCPRNLETGVQGGGSYSPGGQEPCHQGPQQDHGHHIIGLRQEYVPSPFALFCLCALQIIERVLISLNHVTS